MSVKIRLKKLGRRHRPFFRVCAMDTRTRRDGREIELLGTYDPMVSETDARTLLNGERIDYWLSQGAQPSPKVSTLIKKYGTNGSHLEAQKAALEKLGSRRTANISAAITEAEQTKIEVKAEEPPAEPSESAESSEATETEATETETTETAEVTETETAEVAEATEAEPAEASAEAPAEPDSTSETSAEGESTAEPEGDETPEKTDE
ncbi:MAG: 30S ribosomal protein S16 [Planctomycetota bacterium]|nr:30S ribosomal protein S16 [Planctomycetota bacterium]